MNHATTSKLFSALVLGGAVLAGANDQIQIGGDVEEKEPICQVSMVQKDYQGSFSGKAPTVVQTVCLDEKTDEEVLEVIHEAKEESCMSAFCGCWLG